MHKLVATLIFLSLLVVAIPVQAQEPAVKPAPVALTSASYDLFDELQRRLNEYKLRETAAEQAYNAAQAMRIAMEQAIEVERLKALMAAGKTDPTLEIAPRPKAVPAPAPTP